jgi:methylenetetrahydrofolate dehydrogenase (NADP+)/methenyltetrahydrofolate cyclohydrolase
MVKILSGKELAEKMRQEMKSEIDELKTQVGILSREYKFDADYKEEQLLKLIRELNNDPSIHGILVQLPLPDHINEEKILYAIDPTKDVDGFHPVNIGKMMIGAPSFLPCTPHGIQQLLLRNNIEISGKTAYGQCRYGQARCSSN